MSLHRPSVHRKRRGPAGVICASIAILLVCHPSEALDPAHGITQYAHTAWTQQDAQLPASISALAQTSDGVLWIGTELGLLQFDGVHFQQWRAPSRHPLPNDSITALRSARDGSLWIGTRDGLSHLMRDNLENYRTSNGAAGPGVSSIVEDRDGIVWAGTVGYRSGGLCRIEANRLHCYGAAAGLPGLGVFSLFEDREGILWVGGSDGLGRWKPGAPRVYPLRGLVGAIRSVAEGPHGQLWVSTNQTNGLQTLLDGRLEPYPIDAKGPPSHLTGLLTDRDGGLWIGTLGQGLIHLYAGRIDRFTHADGLTNDSVHHLFEDREGNVWAATEGGLDRFRELAVTTIGKREGLSGDTASSVSASKAGGVWVGTVSGLNRIEDHGITIYGKPQGLPSPILGGIFEEQRGRLWVDTSAGLAYSDRGRFHPADQLLFGKIPSIAAMAEDREHSVWFSDPARGLLRFRDMQVAEVLPWSRFGNKQAWALEADLKAGGLWLGFSQGGIAYLKPGGSTQSYTPADGLGQGAVVDLHFARNGTLWIATQGGLSRFQDGHLATLGVANGLPCARIHSMVEDDNGALWLNTACGLIRIAASDLAAWSANPGSRIQVKVYDSSDGISTHPVLHGYTRRAVKSTDGRLWFAVLEGVAVVDPKHLPMNRLAPPVRIEQIAADHTLYQLNAQAPRLPPLTRELEIDYTAFSFVDPSKVLFRYRLEGFDTAWHDAGTRRQALYTNLPPRHYQFRVTASNNDGVWSQTGASLEFFIQPAFYQTRWFQLLCLAAVGLMLWGLYRLRLRQIAAELQVRFEARLAERTRISRELHDNLLQNISGFALQLDGLSKTVAAPASAKDRLRELREQAEEWLREARESVWDLRSPALEGQDLLEALRETGEQITRGRKAKFDMTVMGHRRPLPANLEEQLLRIIREATRNAVRHGQATEIKVSVAYLDPGSIRVQIRDDGCGFDLEEGSRKMGHCGLASMRERAAQIGGELKILTAPGAGTEIEIVVPIASRRQ